MQIGFSGLLCLLFVAAKLFHYIDWSWWWVFSPMWIGTIIIILFLMLGATVTVKK